MQKDFTINIRAYDENIQHSSGLDNQRGSVEDVEITVELAQEDTYERNIIADVFVTEIIEGQWSVIKTLEGQTTKQGEYVGGQQLISSQGFEPNRNMQITITAILGDQVIQKVVETYLLQVSIN